MMNPKLPPNRLPVPAFRPPVSSSSGSSLILTLLLVAILSLVAVGFLSTSRIESIATKNFTRQNAASGLAELATQQAMAKIQQGFTANATGTTVITTQPGAIRQFVFQNGEIVSNPTVNLFTGGGNATTNGTANLNYLNNPTLNATLSGNGADNQWTITGNASQRIDLPLEEITLNGTVLGRVAYYVDDDGTKINLNAATGNRSTLNVADSRSLSLTVLNGIGAVTENAIKTLFDGGASNSTSDISSWTHIFRPEQVYSLGFSINRTTYPPAFFTALPPSDFHMKYTPWGARRLFINDSNATEVPLDSTGVNRIVDALSDPHLRNIYSQTFADKYTPTGLKQIAANMLQYRSKNTMRVNESLAFTGELIGSDNLDANGIPVEYLGLAPYPYINQVGVSGRLAVQANGSNVEFRIIFQICVECAMHMERTVAYYGGGNGSTDSHKKAQIIVELESVSYAVDYRYPTGNSTASGSWSGGGNWGASNSGAYFTQFWNSANSTYRQNFGYYDPVNEFSAVVEGWDASLKGGNHIPNGWPLSPFGGNNTRIYTFARSDQQNNNWPMNPAAGSRYHLGTLGRKDRNGEIAVGFSVPFSSNITVTDIRDVRVKIKSVKILADGSNPKSIRDWVIGQDLPADFPVPVVTNFNSSFSAPASALVPFNMSSPTVGGAAVTLNNHTSSSINNSFTLNGSSNTLIINNSSGLSVSQLANRTVANSAISVSNPRNNSHASSNSTLVWPLPVPAPTQNIHRHEPVLKRPSSLTSLPWESGNITLWSTFGTAPWSYATNTSNAVATGHSNGKNVFGFGLALRKDSVQGSAAESFHGDPGGGLVQGWSFMGDPSAPFTSSAFYRWTENLTIPGDPAINNINHHFHNHTFNTLDAFIFRWPYYGNTFPLPSPDNSPASFVFTDSNGDNLFLFPADLGKVNTNYPYRRLRMQVQPGKEVAISMGGNGSSSLIPDWAMLDVISFGSNTTTLPYNYATPVNINAKFGTPNGTLTTNRSVSLRALLSPFDNTSGTYFPLARNPYNLTGNIALSEAVKALGIGGNWTGNQSTLLANSIGNVTWSTLSKWGSNSSTSVRSSRKFPSGQIVLPSEVVEIANVSDFVTINATSFRPVARASANTKNSTEVRNLKLNEFRLSPLFPGATTCSNFFTIYAYAQALDRAGSIESEALTKTLVEVEITTAATSNGTSTTPAQYKVKKLYTQPIPLGQ